MIRTSGGLLYRVLPHDQWKPGPNADHVSETALDDHQGWDGVFAPEFGEDELDAVAAAIESEVMDAAMPGAM